MDEQLCLISQEIKSNKNDLFQEIVDLVFNVTDSEMDLNSGLDGVETKLTEILNRVRKQVTEKVFENQDPAKSTCNCGRTMTNKQKATLNIVGLVNYSIRRRSFHCPECKIYAYPLDKILRLNGKFSLEVRKASTLVGQRLPFEEAQCFLKALMKVEVSHETIQTIVEDTGKQIAYDEKRAVRKDVNTEGRIKNWDKAPVTLLKGTAYLQMDGSNT